jgi:hypothetical protein
MIAADVQIVRVEIILSAPRPQPEPTEGELRAVLEHLAVTTEAQEPGAETAEVRR